MQRDVTSEPRDGLIATRRGLLGLAALGMAGVRPAFSAGPTGQLTWGVHISLAPTWFDPAETPSLVTPYMLYYAMHDAMVKAMPGELMANSLAESRIFRGAPSGFVASSAIFPLYPATFAISFASSPMDISCIVPTLHIS